MTTAVSDLQLQLLDRVHVISDNFDQYVSQAVIDWQAEWHADLGAIVTPEIAAQIESINEQLADLYQAIGAIE